MRFSPFAKPCSVINNRHEPDETHKHTAKKPSFLFDCYVLFSVCVRFLFGFCFEHLVSRITYFTTTQIPVAFCVAIERWFLSLLSLPPPPPALLTSTFNSSTPRSLSLSPYVMLFVVFVDRKFCNQTKWKTGPNNKNKSVEVLYSSGSRWECCAALRCTNYTERMRKQQQQQK